MSSEMNDTDKLALILAMGFDEKSAQQALNETAGNVELAINSLLSGNTNGEISGASSGAPWTTAEADANTNASSPTELSAAELSAVSSAGVSTTIQGTTSQYNVVNGRSACTCMALAAAREFLRRASAIVEQQQQQQQQPQATVTISPDFLDLMIQSGSAIYAEWMSATAIMSTSGVEHTSPEDALLSGYFSDLSLLEMGVVQGTLVPLPSGNSVSSSNSVNDLHHHPLGWYALLTACQSTTDWVCVVATKPPETVLLCLPPKRSDRSDHSQPNLASEYLLVDSHPRPAQFGTQQAYCRSHTTLNLLIQSSLQVLFPALHLDDENDMMAASMYNSFDLYPLRLSQLSSSTS